MKDVHCNGTAQLCVKPAMKLQFWGVNPIKNMLSHGDGDVTGSHITYDLSGCEANGQQWAYPERLLGQFRSRGESGRSSMTWTTWMRTGGWLRVRKPPQKVGYHEDFSMIFQ